MLKHPPENCLDTGPYQTLSPVINLEKILLSSAMLQLFHLCSQSSDMIGQPISSPFFCGGVDVCGTSVHVCMCVCVFVDQRLVSLGHHSFGII
jgi:hypothetical protein